MNASADYSNNSSSPRTNFPRPVSECKDWFECHLSTIILVSALLILFLVYLKCIFLCVRKILKDIERNTLITSSNIILKKLEDKKKGGLFILTEEVNRLTQKLERQSIDLTVEETKSPGEVEPISQSNNENNQESPVSPTLENINPKIFYKQQAENKENAEGEVVRMISEFDAEQEKDE